MEASHEVYADVDLQRDIVRSYYEVARDNWLGAKALSLSDPSGEALESRKACMKEVDKLLDEYNDISHGRTL